MWTHRFEVFLLTQLAGLILLSTSQRQQSQFLCMFLMAIISQCLKLYPLISCESSLVMGPILDAAFSLKETRYVQERLPQMRSWTLSFYSMKNKRHFLFLSRPRDFFFFSLYKRENLTKWKHKQLVMWNLTLISISWCVFSVSFSLSHCEKLPSV